MYVIVLVISYLLGSVPMGLVFTQLMGRGDLRKVGSGNIGATNVMRVGGLRMAGAVWLLDMAKAIVAVLLGHQTPDIFAMPPQANQCYRQKRKPNMHVHNKA